MLIHLKKKTFNSRNIDQRRQNKLRSHISIIPHITHTFNITAHRKEDTDTKVYCFTVQKQKQKKKILLKKHKK